MTFANPIYDSVFKYLMEDERIARTVLSALLKEEVVSVQMRPHEFANDKSLKVSVYRVDFSATIRKENGSISTILVELQKTWGDEETLRFRQYLGVHYGNPENVTGKRSKQYAHPMVAVYLLGHRVGDIMEPVVYFKHKPYDYYGNEIQEGMPDRFVESLTHDSIFVQIPLLHGKINNHLDKVLTVFDQTRKYKENKHLMQISDHAFEDDPEVRHMLHRLTMAAADPEMRHHMNVEDEIYSGIVERDTQLLEKDKQLSDKDNQIEEQGKQIKEKDSQIEEQGKQIKEKDSQIKEKNKQIKEKDSQIKEKDSMLHSIVSNLIKTGHTPQQIATMFSMDIEKITNIIGPMEEQK